MFMYICVCVCVLGEGGKSGEAARRVLGESGEMILSILSRPMASTTSSSPLFMKKGNWHAKISKRALICIAYKRIS